MSTQGEAYIAQKLAENQTAAARAARVKEFIADSDPAIIDDLFAQIKDAVIEYETQAALVFAKYQRSVAALIDQVEAELSIR